MEERRARGYMGDSKSPTDDEVVRKRAFDIGSGIDLSNFLDDSAVSNEPDVKALPEPSAEDKDVAMGEMFDPFSDEPQAGDVQRDGTVNLPPEMDTITEIATTGEKRLHWGIMVSMIVVYSLVGYLVGTILPPVVGFAGLLGLALLGFFLGERWIPDSGMRMLGITWVIITMKLLYGLAIDLHHWELWGFFPIDATELGLTLLALVGLNLLVAYHHDEDAIAAQATLVLLAIGSGAGAVYGQIGVAGGIIVATILLHGVAIHRQSGNLASLGIAFSNLWIGIHAFSNGWTIGALEIVRFEDPLLLFMLVGGINAVNAAMAARFANKENWFSQGLALVGLGRPGLWSVSIALGMVGALLAISAHRAQTSYSLSMIIMLLACFGGSYLVVRGVEHKRVLSPLGAGLPIFLLLLVGLETNLLGAPFSLTGYDVFSVLAAALTAFVLLSNQSVVSDHVLWGGSLVLVLIMTILIPAQPSSIGGDGALMLLIALSLIHAGTGALSLMRNSPPLAGVTILTPWIWVMIITFWTAGSRTFNAARQVWELDSGVVGWDGWYLVGYLCFATVLQYPVNRAHGGTGVNLASRLLGMSELSARLRDSGVLMLWNLGFILSLIVWIAVTKPEQMSGYGLLLGLAVLLAIHIFAECRNEHQNNPRLLVIAFGIAAIWFQWQFGMDGAWMLFTVIALGSLVLFDERIEVEDILSLLMGFLSLQTVLFALDRNHDSLLGGEPLFSVMVTGWIFLACVGLTLGLYLPRAGKMEKLLKPAASCVVLLIVTIWATLSEGMHLTQTAMAFVLFMGSGVWLSAQGELRAELKAVNKRESRAQRLARISAVQSALEDSQPQPHLLSAPTAGALPTTTTSQSELAIQESDPATSQAVVRDSRTYHFDNEQLAEAALSGESGLIEATSQAVTVGKIKTVAPELYAHAERTKKKSKRRGELSTQEQLYGDIHHRPVVVLTFIAGIIGGGIFSVWFAGSIAAGIMIAVGVSSLVLIAISRWRATANDLTMPDIVGMETPFAATMGGLTLLHAVARLAPGSSIENQIDVAVLAILLVLLGGISLVGRKDLVHRIPSVLGWVVGCLMVSRFAGAVLSGSTPMPILLDPFSGSMMTFTIPWLVLEGVLLSCALGWDWIEGLRRKHGLPDFHGSAGRGGWVMIITMQSIGPAGIIAITLGLRRAFEWKQPAAVALDILAIVIAMQAVSSWVDGLQDYVPLAMVILGIICLIATAVTVPMRAPRWTTAWCWDAHLLLALGLLLLFGTISAFLVVGILALSLTVWVAGILQLRRSLRVWGAADLVIGLVCAALAAQGAIDPMMALLMAIALGLELGIIAWLGQKYEGELAID